MNKNYARTLKLKELFSWSEDLTKDKILDRLRQEGLIGEGLFGRLQGECFLRTVHPANEPGMITGYYFHKGENKRYHLTYAGGMDF